MNEAGSRNSGLLKLILHGICLVLLLYFGFQVGQTALTDPDTCFLVAVGRKILQGGVPAHDSFSWTAADAPYIVYQWLAAASLAWLERSSGAFGLTILTGVAVAAAFFLIPLVVARLHSLSLPVMLVVVGLGFAAASFHFPCRPEIFSYMLLSSLLAISCREPFNSRLLSAVSFLAFALWSNLHSGFVLGLFLLFVVLSAASFRKESRNHTITYAKILTAAFLGSFVNPYGTALWGYLPHLFFSKVNQYNLELQPISAVELLSSDYLPFLLLLGCFLAAVIYAFRSRPNYLVWSNLFCSLIAIVGAFGCRRLLPFAVLFIYGFFYVSLGRTNDHPGKNGAGALADTETKDDASIDAGARVRSYLPFLLSALATVCAGLNTATWLFKPALPQTTFGFDSPETAFNFMDQSQIGSQSRRPQGRLLNDPQFGDVMLLRYGDKAQVFIDTRFDLYGDALVLDFWNMANLRGDWSGLMAKYQIDWIFFPPRAPIVAKLREDKNWELVFADDRAVILKRLKREN